MKTSGRLANRELTSLVKEATGVKMPGHHYSKYWLNVSWISYNFHKKYGEYMSNLKYNFQTNMTQWFEG